MHRRFSSNLPQGMPLDPAPVFFRSLIDREDGLVQSSCARCGGIVISAVEKLERQELEHVQECTAGR